MWRIFTSRTASTTKTTSPPPIKRKVSKSGNVSGNLTLLKHVVDEHDTLESIASKYVYTLYL
jgi:hypothetical protein